MSSTAGTDQTQARQVMESGAQLYRLCMESAAYGAQEGGDYGRPKTLQALHDTADLSLVLINLLARASRLHRAQAEVTRKAAEQCAEVLRPFEQDDGQLRATFAACRSFVTAIDELTGAVTREGSSQRDEALKETFPGSDSPPPPTEL